MTRINLVRPEELSDQHLLAELRELPRIFTLAEKNPDVSNIPKTFRLGTGHMNFFKNKLIFLYQRYFDLYMEWNRRGFNYKYGLTSTLHKFVDIMNKRPELVQAWIPRERDIKLSKARLQEKIDMKPDFYRWS